MHIAPPINRAARDNPPGNFGQHGAPRRENRENHGTPPTLDPAPRPVLHERSSAYADCLLSIHRDRRRGQVKCTERCLLLQAQAMEGSRDQPARRYTASMDDSRCERGAPHTTLGIGSHAATRIALLPTWVVAGGQSQLRAHPGRLRAVVPRLTAK